MRDNIPDHIKTHFKHFIEAAPERLHFAAHSHHAWPDISLQAHTQYWHDSAQMIDDKWSKIFNDIIPSVQKHISTILSLPHEGSTIAFAPNTHEFINRLLSSLPTGSPPKILTTDSEFHSFNRQISRLEQEGLIEIKRVKTQDFTTFEARFFEAAKSQNFDMIFLSQTFFNSGFRIPDIEKFILSLDQYISSDTVIVVDGYHAFMAVPTNLYKIASRIFYVAGGYKYAMAGEGCCFMHCPNNFLPEPRNTGWFATMDQLSNKQNKVTYSQNGFRFMGSTFDPSGLYRMQAVFEWLNKLEVTVDFIHEHVEKLMVYFIQLLIKADIQALPLKSLLINPQSEHSTNLGHFLTFDLRNASQVHAALSRLNIVTDYRDTRLRFGFGIYHDKSDVELLIQKLTLLKL